MILRVARLPPEPTATMRTILQGLAPLSVSTNEPRAPALECHCRPAADTRTLSCDRKPRPRIVIGAWRMTWRDAFLGASEPPSAVPAPQPSAIVASIANADCRSMGRYCHTTAISPRLISGALSVSLSALVWGEISIPPAYARGVAATDHRGRCTGWQELERRASAPARAKPRRRGCPRPPLFRTHEAPGID